jgi:hypothetical protein
MTNQYYGDVGPGKGEVARLQTRADCPNARSVSILDRHDAVYRAPVLDVCAKDVWAKRRPPDG